jgi:hypothetical protein
VLLNYTPVIPPPPFPHCKKNCQASCWKMYVLFLKSTLIQPVWYGYICRMNFLTFFWIVSALFSYMEVLFLVQQSYWPITKVEILVQEQLFRDHYTFVQKVLSIATVAFILVLIFLCDLSFLVLFSVSGAKSFCFPYIIGTVYDCQVQNDSNKILSATTYHLVSRRSIRKC